MLVYQNSNNKHTCSRRCFYTILYTPQVPEQSLLLFFFIPLERLVWKTGRDRESFLNRGRGLFFSDRLQEKRDFCTADWMQQRLAPTYTHFSKSFAEKRRILRLLHAPALRPEFSYKSFFISVYSNLFWGECVCSKVWVGCKCPPTFPPHVVQGGPMRLKKL